MSKLAWQARYFTKERIGEGGTDAQPNPKPLDKGNKGLPEPRKPREQPGERFIPSRGQEPGGQADCGAKPQPLEPNPAEQQARERLGKPPPEGVGEQPVQKAIEPKGSFRPLSPNVPEEEVVETLDPEVEEAIRDYAEGDPEEEAQLREQAKKDPILREFFKKGPTPLTSSSPDFSIIRNPEDMSDS